MSETAGRIASVFGAFFLFLLLMLVLIIAFAVWMWRRGGVRGKAHVGPLIDAVLSAPDLPDLPSLRDLPDLPDLPDLDIDLPDF